MDMTVTELAAILSPAMTRKQVTALIAVSETEPTGFRRLGQRGRPPAIYDMDAILREHEAEAARTAKQFTDNDWIGHALLARGVILADPAAGELRWRDGSRAELPNAALYGYVPAGHESCLAHRIIWIACEGEIPPFMQVNHVNKRHWDNRRPNLEIVSLRNNVRHAQGKSYFTYPEALEALAELRETAPQLPPPSMTPVRAGGAFLAGRV